MTRTELPSFDLVVATLDRVDELGRLLHSLARQSHRRFRVIVVDQNTDDRLDAVLRRYSELQIDRLRSQPGLSHARNAALLRVSGDPHGVTSSWTRAGVC